MIKTSIITISSVILLTTASVWAVSFEIGESYSAGQEPFWLSKADFNSDGHLDLAVGHCDEHLYPEIDANSGISVFFGNGDGTFAEAVQYVTGFGTLAICAGDFDGDGDIDLASTRPDRIGFVEPDSLCILLNDGEGVFELSPRCETAVVGCLGMCAVDVDGDSSDDLVMTGYMNDTLCIMKNGGTGSFALDTCFAAGDYVTRVCAGDFDSDGDDDLALVNFDNLLIYTNDGFGDFTFADGYSNSDQTDILVSDFDRDGDGDLMTVSQATDLVTVRLNSGDATFPFTAYIPVPFMPFSGALADFDGDGNEDLALTCHVWDSVSILLGTGDGAFVMDSKYSIADRPISLEAGDYDEDGDYDLVVVNNYSNEITIMLNTTVVTDVTEEDKVAEVPSSFGLRQNYPNPFNSSTNIQFDLSQRAFVEMTIYNIAGQVVRYLVTEEMSAGVHTVEWNGSSDAGVPVATGIYLCHLKAGDFVSMKKMALLK
ncbi:MAG: FG-GAP-like repeat-containing protein [Candidatus Zixiibacteriota bacterium]